MDKKYEITYSEIFNGAYIEMIDLLSMNSDLKKLSSDDLYSIIHDLESDFSLMNYSFELFSSEEKYKKIKFCICEFNNVMNDNLIIRIEELKNEKRYSKQNELIKNIYNYLYDINRFGLTIYEKTEKYIYIFEEITLKRHKEELINRLK